MPKNDEQVVNVNKLQTRRKTSYKRVDISEKGLILLVENGLALCPQAANIC
jgi:c-di-GMP-binding flagellar brake protein YcgR